LDTWSAFRHGACSIMPNVAPATTTPSAAFPFESKFVTVNGEPMHYVEQGNGKPIVLLHGLPVHVYVWRNVIPLLAEKGRVIAVDLHGFGKSGKKLPGGKLDFDIEYGYLEGFFAALNLSDILLVVQDIGSVFGFHYAHTHAENIRGLVLFECVARPIEDKNLEFSDRIANRVVRSSASYLIARVFNGFVSGFIPSAILRKLSKEEMRAYSEPFPDKESRVILSSIPQVVALNGKPAASAAKIAAYSKWLTETSLPKLFFKGSPGFLVKENTAAWIEANMRNLTTVDLGKGLHFFTEDYPEEFAGAIKEWMNEKKLV